MAIPGRMTKFKITELSGVNRPAQLGARVTFMKREDETMLDEFIKREFSDAKRKELASSGKALPDGSFPIENEADLHNAVSAFGRAKDPAKAKAHIKSRAQAMGMTGALPDSWVSKGATQMDPKELRKSLGLPESASDTDVITALAKAKDDSDAEADKARKEAKKASDEKAAAEDDAKKAKKAAAVSDLDPDEKEHYDGLGDDAKDTFLAKPKDERKKAAKVAKAADEILVVGSTSVRKSVVGDGVFAVLKAQQEQIDAGAAELKKAKDEACTATFTKQAETEFAHVAGTLDQRVVMLKGIDLMTDPVAKKAVLDALTAAEAMAKTAFSRVGAGGALEPGFAKTGGTGNGNGAGFTKADGELDRLAKEYEKAHAGMSYAKAYDNVVQANPQLYEQSQQEARALAAAN